MRHWQTLLTTSIADKSFLVSRLRHTLFKCPPPDHINTHPCGIEVHANPLTGFFHPDAPSTPFKSLTLL